MYKLDLKISELHPDQYIDMPSKDEVYADISLDVQLDGGKIFNVFKIKWDAMCFLNWFIENKQAIIYENPIELIDGGVSIACGIEKFYGNVDPDNLAELDMVFEYSKRHGLRFALRGVDINEVYIGKTEKGYEISYCNNDSIWSYKIDLLEFIASIESYYVKLKNK